MVRGPDASLGGNQLLDDWRDRRRISSYSVRQWLYQSTIGGGRGAWRAGGFARRSLVRGARAREMVEAVDGPGPRSRQHHLSAADAVIEDDSPSLVRLEVRLGHLLV